MNPPLTPPRRGTDGTRTNSCSPPGRGRGWVGSWRASFRSCACIGTLNRDEAAAGALASWTAAVLCRFCARGPDPKAPEDWRTPKPRAVPAGSWREPSSWLIFPLLVAVLLVGGCARLEPPADLVIVNGAEPESLDPGIITGEADGRVALELFGGLTRYNPTDAAPIPDLAESWDISPDGKLYTFHLRPDAVWSTGEP